MQVTFRLDYGAMFTLYRGQADHKKKLQHCIESNTRRSRTDYLLAIQQEKDVLRLLDKVLVLATLCEGDQMLGNKSRLLSQVAHSEATVLLLRCRISLSRTIKEFNSLFGLVQLTLFTAG